MTLLLPIETTACFTGHRPAKIGGYDENNPQTNYVKYQLSLMIEVAIQRGYTSFISGMALGVDTIAARLVLSKRNHGKPIRLICAVPFAGQEERWPAPAQRLYHEILREADDVQTLYSDGYAGWKMLKRDEWMVDHSSLVIAVWNGDERGGTAHTVQYAQSASHLPRLLRIDPNQYTTQ